jgi:hypothetical protein
VIYDGAIFHDGSDKLMSQYPILFWVCVFAVIMTLYTIVGCQHMAENEKDEVMHCVGYCLHIKAKSSEVTTDIDDVPEEVVKEVTAIRP